jgi:hypothetical protein
MPLPGSGPIKFSNINEELALPFNASLSINNVNARNLSGVVLNNSRISLSNFYGKASRIAATGGNRIYDINIGNQVWRVHEFTSNGNFNVTSSSSRTGFNGVEYLLVGGGGGGGAGNTVNINDTGIESRSHGGGGAGGILTNDAGGSLLPVSVQNYPITVGTGGLGANSSIVNAGGDGTSSIALSLEAGGGGGGGAGINQNLGGNSNGRSGASSGGGGARFASFYPQFNYAGVSFSPNGKGIGNLGGVGFVTSVSIGRTGYARAGGGGGAGGIGIPGTSSPGNGGPGISNNITGISYVYSAGGPASGGTITNVGAPVTTQNTALNNGTNPPTRYGFGGSGATAAYSFSGQWGAPGIVLLRYRIS